MYVNELPDHMSPAVQARYKLERTIVQSLVTELIDHGFWLCLDDGDGSSIATNDGPVLLDSMMETDIDRIEAYPNGGSVLLVYGNDGWDVIADYSPNLEPLIAKTLDLSAAFERAVEHHAQVR